MNKKKVLLSITEILIGPTSTISSSTMGLNNPGAGIIISRSTTLISSIAILITNQNFSKLKIRYNIERDWIYVITLLYEKCLKPSVVDKKSYEKEAEEMKNNIIITLIREKR